MAWSAKCPLLGLVTVALLDLGAAQADELSFITTQGWPAPAANEAIDNFMARRGDRVVTQTVPTGADQTIVAVRSDNPPEMARLDLATLKQLVDQGLVRDLDDVASAGRWQGKFAESVLRPATLDGKLQAIPMDVVGENWMWINKDVFRQIGVPEPRTWDDFFGVAPILQSHGIIPLALGADEWQLVILFNAVLIGNGGKATYLATYRDRNLMTHANEFATAVVTFTKLRDLVDAGSVGRRWDEATSLVVQGKAAMQFMGGWAERVFLDGQKVPGVNYDCLLGPGDQALAISADYVFFPRNVRNQDGQKRLADLMGDGEFQSFFSHENKSTPARVDADGSQLDFCARKAAGFVNAGQEVPAFSTLVSPSMARAIGEAIVKFWFDPSQPAQTLIGDLQGLLSEP